MFHLICKVLSCDFFFFFFNIKRQHRPVKAHTGWDEKQIIYSVWPIRITIIDRKSKCYIAGNFGEH